MWAYIRLSASYTNPSGKKGNFEQGYKREVGHHDDPAQQRFVKAALATALAAIQTQAPGFKQSDIRQPKLTLSDADPGVTYRAI